MVERHEDLDDPYEIAADWADRLSELNEAQRRELADWLGHSQENAQAFAAMRHLLSDTALLEALEEGPSDNAETDPALPPLRPRPGRSLHASAAGRSARKSPIHINRRQALAAGLAGALALPVAGYWFTHPSESAPLRFASAVGLRRKVALPDGSTMILDAASRVSVNFAGSRRMVQLEEGAAQFDVRHDPERPFEVHTPQARMVALGTLFSVDHLTDASELRVYEGRVGLETPFGTRSTVPAREWALIGNTKVLQTGTFDPASGNDWQNDWLDAHEMRLGQAVERLARYSEVPIRLADPDMAERTFSGRFRLDRPQQSLELIGSLFELHLKRENGTLVLAHDQAFART